MELLLRKHLWAVNLAFLLIAAWMSAKTVNTFVSGALQPMPDFSAPAPSAEPSAAAEKPVLKAGALAKLMGIELPAEPEVVEPSRPDGLDGLEPVRTSLRVRLVGTMLANEPEWSMASIQDLASNETSVYMVADLIQGASVVGIERLRVLLNNNGRREFIDAEPGAIPATMPEVGLKPGMEPASGIGATVKTLGENSYEIPRQTILDAMSDLNGLAKDVRIVPAYKGGQANGFKLFGVRPGSLFSNIGIQNGDVVRRINGYDMNSPEKALELYSKLKDSGRIEIELERRGTSVTKTYNIR
jgi:general secretion pathway protein C